MRLADMAVPSRCFQDTLTLTRPPDAHTLEQLRWAHQAGLPRGVALLDAGYGNNTALRGGITALGMPYAAGICATTTVWAPGTQSGRGRPGTRLRRNRKHRPLSVKALALRQPKSAWQTISWREGTAAPLASRFTCLRAC
jgi:SRSO17 transposase